MLVSGHVRGSMSFEVLAGGIARLKWSWNVEQWRPAVGLGATFAARCNP
ncbi:MAG: DUF2599 domain-containing protein [Pseudoclavibacter sp.]